MRITKKDVIDSLKTSRMNVTGDPADVDNFLDAVLDEVNCRVEDSDDPLAPSRVAEQIALTVMDIYEEDDYLVKLVAA